DFGLDRAARKSGWHGHRKVAGRNEGDRAGAAHLNLCGADLCSLLKQWLGLPRVEAPLDQPSRFLNTGVPAIQARDHFDQPAAVLTRRAGEAIARLVRVPRLE